MRARKASRETRGSKTETGKPIVIHRTAPPHRRSLVVYEPPAPLSIPPRQCIPDIAVCSRYVDQPFLSSLTDYPQTFSLRSSHAPPPPPFTASLVPGKASVPRPGPSRVFASSRFPSEVFSCFLSFLRHLPDIGHQYATSTGLRLPPSPPFQPPFDIRAPLSYTMVYTESWMSPQSQSICAKIVFEGSRSDHKVRQDG